MEARPLRPTLARRPNGFSAALLLIVLGFCVVLLQRDRIRAAWWGYRLAASPPGALAARGYYLACIASVGDKAAGTIQRLARDARPDVRILSVAALQQLSEPARHGELARLLSDEDGDVRQAAALALAFLADENSVRCLVVAAESKNAVTAACAVSALGRVGASQALAALCLARHHPEPIVRAEAVAALADQLEQESTGESARSAGHDGSGAIEPCDPLGALIEALSDRSVFQGLLIIERRIEEVCRAVHAQRPEMPLAPATPRPAPSGRTVAEVAAERLSRLTDRPISLTTPPTASERAELRADCHKRLALRTTSRPVAAVTEQAEPGPTR